MMKVIPKVILVLAMASWHAPARPQAADPYLSDFLAVARDETVYLRWTIRQGNTCEDTFIERSGDGLTYQRIGQIGGVCGSPDRPVTYEFSDTVPLANRINYYRLELGLLGYSSPRSVDFLVFGEGGYSIIPNPASSSIRLVFDNPAKEEFILEVNDTGGKSIFTGMTAGNEFRLDLSDYPSGVYPFSLRSGNRSISGKILRM